MKAETRAKERKTRGHPSAQVGQPGEKQRPFCQKRHDLFRLGQKEPVWFKFSDSSQKSGDGEINAPALQGQMRSLVNQKAFPNHYRRCTSHLDVLGDNRDAVGQ